MLAQNAGSVVSELEASASKRAYLKPVRKCCSQIKLSDLTSTRQAYAPKQLRRTAKSWTTFFSFRASVACMSAMPHRRLRLRRFRSRTASRNSFPSAQAPAETFPKPVRSASRGNLSGACERLGNSDCLRLESDSCDSQPVRGSETRRPDGKAESQRQMASNDIRTGEADYPALNSASRFRRVSWESPAISESIKTIRAFKASRTPDEIRPRDNKSISDPSNP